MGRLDGKVALVTGGARGMGASHVRHLLAEGARVVFGDLRDVEGKALAADQDPDRCRYLHHDVTSEDDWAHAVAATLSAFGRLDVLVNNAGILLAATIQRMPAADFRQVLEVNLVGSWLGIRQVVPAMRDGGGGSIINMSSVEGFAGAAGLSAYSASKFAVRGLTRSAAQELGRHGIRVNSVHPGGILTPLLLEVAGVAGTSGDATPVGNGSTPGVLSGKSLSDKARSGASLIARMPISRLGEPSEVSMLVVFLASDESSYCTGSEFVVDGGMISGPGY